jgi:hypothetical protein
MMEAIPGVDCRSALMDEKADDVPKLAPGKSNIESKKRD